MLAPEVLNFSIQRRRTTRAESRDPTKIPALEPFCSRLHLAIPGLLHLPKELEAALERDWEYYHVVGFPVDCLFAPEVIQNFVRGGELTLVSDASAPNRIFVSPDGAATLLLSTDTFLSLGIEGRPVDGQENLFVARFDLGSNKNEKVLSRARGALRDRKAEFGAVTFAWYPNDASICPSSLANHLHDLGAKVVERSQATAHRRTTCVPRVLQRGPPSVSDADFDDVDSWLGSVLLGIEHEQLESDTSGEAALASTADGLFVTRHIEAIVASVMKYLEGNEDCGWIVLSFANSRGPMPKSRGKQWLLEHQSATILCRRKSGIIIRGSGSGT